MRENVVIGEASKKVQSSISQNGAVKRRADVPLHSSL